MMRESYSVEFLKRYGNDPFYRDHVLQDLMSCLRDVGFTDDEQDEITRRAEQAWERRAEVQQMLRERETDAIHE